MGAGAKWTFSTVDDIYPPKIVGIFQTGGTLASNSLDASATRKFNETGVDFIIQFNEPVLADASNNEDITIYFKDQNYALFNAEDPFSFNTYTNSNLNSGGSEKKFITYVTNAGGGTPTTSATRFIRVNLTAATHTVITADNGTVDGHDRLAAGSNYSIGWGTGAFYDVSGSGNNDHLGVNQSNNRFTFGINAATTAPEVADYSAASTSGGFALLGTDLIIDFSEPVNPIGTGMVRFYFDADDSEVINLRLDPSDGVASNAKTRYTYSLPENLKGSNGYYITIDASSFEDLEGTDMGAYDGSAEIFTTVSDAIAPIMVDITPNDNTLTTTVAGTDLVIEFDEPVRSVTTGGGSIRFYYSNGEEFSSINVNSDPTNIITPNIKAGNYATVLTIDLNKVLDSEGRKLRPGQDFYLTMDASAFEDKSGNDTDLYIGDGLIADDQLSFRVADNATTPYIVSTGTTDIEPTLANNSVVETSPFIVEFSEAVTAVSNKYLTVYYDDATDNVAILRWLVTDGTASRGNTVFTFEMSDVVDGENVLSGATNYFALLDDGAFVEEHFVTQATDDFANTFWNGSASTMGATSWTFTTRAAETTKPTFALNPIDGATNVPVTQVFDLIFNERVTATGGTLSIYYADNGTLYEQFNLTAGATDNSTSFEGTTVSFNPVDLPGNTNYYIQITDAQFIDADGNTTSTSISTVNDWNFTTAVDAALPTVVSIDYDNTLLNPANVITVVVEFSERVTREAGDLYIEYGDTDNTEVYRFEAGSGTKDNSVSGKGSFITYTIPAGTLRGNVTYYLGIEGTAFADATGNFMTAVAADAASGATFSFTTTTDSAIPSIVSLTPADGATGVLDNTNLVIEFDQPITRVAGNKIEIHYTLGEEQVLNAGHTGIYTIDPTAGSLSVSNTIWTFNLAAVLEGATDYYINILADAFRDNSAAQLAPYSTKTDWNFTTAAGEGDALDLLELDPSEGSTSVNIRQDLLLTFDEPVYLTNKNITLSHPRQGDITINALDENQVLALDKNGDNTAIPSGNSLFDPVPFGKGAMAIRINPTNDLFGTDVSVVDNAGDLEYTVNATSAYTLTIPDGTFVNADGDAYSFTAEALVSGGADANKWEFTTKSGVYPSTFSTVGAPTGSDLLPRFIACMDNEYISLQETIYIKESNVDDFGNGTIIFTLSSGFEFENGVGNATGVGTGGIADIVVSNPSTLTITLSGVNDAAQELIPLSGLKIKYTGTDVSATGTIKRTGGTADLYGMSVSHNTNILDIEVELVNQLVVINSGTPTDGQVLVANTSICEDFDFYDDVVLAGDQTVQYRSKTTPVRNGKSDFSLEVNPNGDNETPATENTINWYDGSDVYASDGGTSNILLTGNSGSSIDPTWDDLDGTSFLDETVVGDKIIYVTQMNLRGCESTPTAITVEVLAVPTPAETDAIAGQNYNDAEQVAATSIFGSVCKDEEVVLGASTNESLEDLGYTFAWSGEVIDGNSTLETDENPTFNAPANGGYTGPRTVTYSVRVTDENGCRAQSDATVTVTVDREVRPDIFSENGLTFIETVSSGQPIFGDFGDESVDFGINETDPDAVDASLIIQIGTNSTASTDHYYTTEPYVGRTAAGTDYSFTFTGNGLGNTTNTDDYHKVTFTPSAVGPGSYPITYNMTEDFSGCSASASLTITVLASADDLFDETNFADNPVNTDQIIASVDDGDLDQTSTPVIEHLVTTLNNPGVYTFQRFEGPGIYQDGFVMTMSGSATALTQGTVVYGSVTLSGTQTVAVVRSTPTGSQVILDSVQGTFITGEALFDKPVADATRTQLAGGVTISSIDEAVEVALRMNAAVSGLTAGNTVTATGSGAQGTILDVFDNNVILNVTSGSFITGDGLGGTTVQNVFGNFEINLAHAFNATPAADFLVVNSNSTHTATVELVVVEDATSAPFVYGSKELVISPLPTVVFANVNNHFNDINRDNANQSLDIDLTLTNSAANTTTVSNVAPVEYTLTVQTGVGVDNAGNTLTITGSVLDFQSIITNATIGLTANDLSNQRDEISYTLNVRSQASNDPLFKTEDLNGFGSPVTIEKTITLYKRQDRPTLVIDGSSNKFISEIDVSNTSDTDYWVEYCEFETIPNVIVTPETSGLPTTIKWYYSTDDQRATRGDQIAVPNGRNVAAFTLFGTSTPAPGKYVFRFTQTSNTGITGFGGTESDFSTLTFVIHDVPDAPRLNVVDAGSTRGEEQEVGEKYVFEYCDGDVVEGLTIFTGSYSQDFSSDPTTTTSTDDGWFVPATGTTEYNGSGIEIEANEIVRSAYLDKVNQITFKAASSVDGTNVTFEVRYYEDETASGDGAYEVLDRISTSSGTLSSYSFTLESFNDPDVSGDNSVIRFAADGGNGANVIIDDFSASAMIDDQSVYDWYVYNASTSTYVLVDGFNLDGNAATLDANDGVGEGAFTAAGNISATATELFTAYASALSVTTGNDDTPPAGTYTFGIKRREDINYDNDVDFVGCQSSMTVVEINVYSVPGTPSGFLTDINAASGVAPTTGNDVTYNARILPSDEINTPETANTAYRWYYDNTSVEQAGNEFSEVRPDNSNGWTGETFASFTYSDVTDIFGSVPTSVSGHYAPASELNDQIYLAQVTNLLNRKTDATIVTSYVGCETPAASRQEVDFTIYTLANIPVVGAYSAYRDSTLTYFDKSSGDTHPTLTANQIGDYVEFDFEADELTGDTIFYAQTFYTDATNNQKFRWYFSDASGTRSTSEIIPNGQGLTDDPKDQRISAADMLIAGITNNATRYFLLTQITEIEDDGQTKEFAGAESEGTLIRINIYNTPDAPAESSSASASDPGKLNFYYCEGESVDALQVKSYDENASTNIFYWYRSEADALEQDSTKRLSTADARGLIIQPSEMLNDNISFPDDNGVQVTPSNMAGTPPPGTYTFYVTQASNKKYRPNSNFVGDPFYGNESDPLELTVYVRDVPIAPAVIDQTLFICETDNTPSFRISGFDPKITYVWYDSLTTLGLGTRVEQARGQTFTPANYQNAGVQVPGYYGYAATQITDINLNNEGFAGCESPETVLELSVLGIPDAPSTANATNLYTICEREDVLTLAIDNADSRNTSRYTWYDQDNEVLGTGLTFAPNNYIDQSNLTPEVANDTRFRVKYTRYINTAENFNGCTSDFTDITHRINGLADLSFIDIATNNKYCIELDTIKFSATTLGIDGTGRFSLFNDFASTGSGLTDNGDGTAYLLLDTLHINDVDIVNPQPNNRRLIVGGNATSRNIYYEFTDVNGCVNTDSVRNIVTNPFPAIDFSIDDEVTENYVTCLSDTLDIEGERSFFLVGFYDETGASIAKQGQLSDFRIYDELDNELEVGILSDLDARAEFSPQDARKSLSSTNKSIQDYSAQNYYTLTFTHRDENGCTNVVDNRITVNPRPQFKTQTLGASDFIINNKACATETVEFDVDMENILDSETTFTWFVENDQITESQELLAPADDDQVSVLAEDYNIGGGETRIVVIAQDDNTGCLKRVIETKQIGVIPDVRFRYENITIGKKTGFEFQERELDVRYSEISEADLTIWDANGNEVFKRVEGIDFTMNDEVAGRSGDFDIKPGFDTLTFTDPGIYSARFYLNSSANCSSVDSVGLFILDKIIVPQNGILHTFNDGPEGWYTDSVSVDGYYHGLNDSILGRSLSSEQIATSIPRYSTWEWAQPSGDNLNFNDLTTTELNVSGGAWVTNANGRYANRFREGNPLAENSWVYSPTYDLSDLEKPAISFSYSSDLVNRDGVVLQYSIDEGYNWKPIGEFDFEDGNSGINWYNASALPGNPGNIDDSPNFQDFNFEQFGWTRATNVPEGSPIGTVSKSKDYYWYFAANKIDAKDANGSYLIPEEGWSDIRFRFALGSNPGEKRDENNDPIEGFAFDNFRIYDRQKVILFESFSSALSDESKEAETIIGDRVDKAGDGTVWVNYFTDLDGLTQRPTDSLFLRNEIDPGARGGYYGVSDVPTSVLDGEVVQKQPLSDSRANQLLGWNQFALNKKELVEPEFDITLEELTAATTDELKVRGTFTSLIKLPANSELSFRFIIFENYVTNKEFGLYTTTDTIRNVMRAILPDAGGYVEKGNVNVGETFEFEIDWTIDAVFNLDELRVVAFVQNEETRDIYQVAVIDIDNKTNTLTGIGDQIKRGVDYAIYPNPADYSFRVSFDEAVPVDTEWSLYDQMGRLMKSGVMRKNQYEVIINTEDVASGVYFLQLFDEGYRWEPKRLMILHN